MDIHEIKANLKRSIFKKEMLVATYENTEIRCYPEQVRLVLISSLKKNIDELSDILKDLEEVAQ